MALDSNLERNKLTDHQGAAIWNVASRVLLMECAKATTPIHTKLEEEN